MLRKFTLFTLVTFHECILRSTAATDTRTSDVQECHVGLLEMLMSRKSLWQMEKNSNYGLKKKEEKYNWEPKITPKSKAKLKLFARRCGLSQHSFSSLYLCSQKEKHICCQLVRNVLTDLTVIPPSYTTIIARSVCPRSRGTFSADCQVWTEWGGQMNSAGFRICEMTHWFMSTYPRHMTIRVAGDAARSSHL